MNKTQLTTGRVRFSYVTVFEPKAINGGDEKYSCTLIVPKTDTNTIARVKAAIEAAKQRYVDKNGKLPKNLDSIVRDGDGTRPSDDEPYGDECKGAWILNVKSKKKPVLVNADKTPMTNPNEMYSGCYGKAIINFYVYSNSGKTGVSADLLGLMKLSDGEPLGGGVVTDDAWDEGEGGGSEDEMFK